MRKMYRKKFSPTVIFPPLFSVILIECPLKVHPYPTFLRKEHDHEKITCNSIFPDFGRFGGIVHRLTTLNDNSDVENGEPQLPMKRGNVFQMICITALHLWVIAKNLQHRIESRFLVADLDYSTWSGVYCKSIVSTPP